MSDEDGLKPQTEETPQDGKTGAPQAEARSDWFTGLDPRTQAYIEELRSENAKWRVEKKRAEDNARKEAEKRMAEQEQWKELADARAAKLAEIEPKAERALAAFEALIDARLKRIPSDIRKRMVDPIRANMDSVAFVEWLDANETMLTLTPAPNLEAGAGAQAQGKGTPELTDEERRMAQKMGLDLALVAKEKARLSK
jgi:hypothetical protein